MTVHEMIVELGGLKCRCGAVKVPKQTFCRSCYYSLTPTLRRALYDRIGEGYEAAYTAACAWLEDKGIGRAL